MNKAQLIDAVATRVGCSKKQAEDMINSFIALVTETLKKGDEVSISGFGQFSSRKRAARMGVNPRNPSEKISIPEVVVPKFKAGKGLKDALK